MSRCAPRRRAARRSTPPRHAPPIVRSPSTSQQQDDGSDDPVLGRFDGGAREAAVPNDVVELERQSDRGAERLPGGDRREERLPVVQREVVLNIALVVVVAVEGPDALGAAVEPEAYVAELGFESGEREQPLSEVVALYPEQI